MESSAGQKIPTIVPVAKNFTPGKGIKIHCVVPLGTSRFNASLHCGTDITRQDDIAMQVTFNMLNNNATVNSRHKGNWNEELSIPGIPFKCGERVQLFLLCDYSIYKVFINGQHYCDFPQNVTYDQITYLTINGDVIILQVSYEADASTCFGFGRTDIPLTVYDFDGQPKNDASTPLNSSNLQPIPRSKVKQYILFSVLLLIILILIVLLAVLIPLSQKGKDKYDYD